MTFEEASAVVDAGNETQISELLESGLFWELEPLSVFRLAVGIYKRGFARHALRVLDHLLQGNRETYGTEFYCKILHLRATICLDAAEYTQAAAHYTEIIDNMESDVAYANRALCHSAVFEFQAALDDYLQALRINPDNEIAHCRAGEMYIKLDQVLKAFVHLERALELKPHYHAALDLLACAHILNGEVEDAFEVLEVIRTGPGSEESQNRRRKSRLM